MSMLVMMLIRMVIAGFALGMGTPERDTEGVTDRATEAAALGVLGADQPAPAPVQIQPDPNLKLRTDIPVVAPEASKTPFTGPINTADDLLRALETADADLKSLRADIWWSKVWGDGVSDRHVRTGTIEFQDERSPGDEAGSKRRFAALFKTLIIGERRTDEPKEYVFDGKRLMEKMPAQKKATVLIEVEPGTVVDPMRLGKGPIPIPIGQRREDILSRFEAKLLPGDQDLQGEDDAETEELKKFAANSMQLLLIPKDEKDKYKEVRLWYRRGSAAKGDPQLLPRMARAVSRSGGGDVDLVRLIGVKTNAPVDAKTFDTSVPSGWQVQESSRAQSEGRK